jgi:hypothetical protein
LVSWNIYICRVAFAPRDTIDVLFVVWVLGAEVDVVAVSIGFTVTTACAAVVGRGALANVFQASHVWVVEPSIGILAAIVSDGLAFLNAKLGVTLAEAYITFIFTGNY